MRITKEITISFFVFIVAVITALNGFNLLLSSASITRYSIGAGMFVVGLIGGIIFGVRLLSWWRSRERSTYDDIVAEAKRDAGITESDSGKK